jgi:fatty acid synthase subunit alpha
MMYEEVTLRMVRLMFVEKEGRWVDVSLRNLTGDWLRRVEERTAGVNGGGAKASILQSYTALDDPFSFVTEFFEKYPASTVQLLASEDKAYFLTISQRPGQKPAPFIPVLDANFEVWFKRVCFLSSACSSFLLILISLQDSLWAAEDIEAVFDQDPQRVCILQGPVAVKHAKVKDEPIKDILGNVTSVLVEKLIDRVYGGDTNKISTVDYLGAKPAVVSQLNGIKKAESANEVTYALGATLPDVSSWLETLAGPELAWSRALLSSPTIVQGTSYVDNPIRRLLSPRRGQKVTVSPTSITVYGAARSYGPHKNGFKALEIIYTPVSGLIDVTIFKERREVSVPLSLHFQYMPSMGSIPIHEIAEGCNNCIKQFYWKLWYGDNEVLPDIDIREKFTGPEITIEANDVERLFVQLSKTKARVSRRLETRTSRLRWTSPLLRAGRLVFLYAIS